MNRFLAPLGILTILASPLSAAGGDAPLVTSTP